MIKRDINSEFEGRWHSVLLHAGIEHQFLSGKHTPCVFCGGKDRARWIKDKEILFCSQCEGKGGMTALMQWLSLSFKETCDYLRGSTTNYNKVKKMDDLQEQKKNKQRLGNIKKSCVTIARGSVVANYFRGRGVKVSKAQNIAHGQAPYYEDGTKTGVFDVVAATVSDINGRAATLHLTYLDDAGKKLDVESPKKVMPKVSDWSGGAIRLFPVKDDGVLAIAEGVETALAVQNSEGIPCWAVINANNLSRFKVPSYVKHLLIYADSDKSFTGQLAAYLLAKSIKDECRKSGSEHEVKVILLHENNGIKEIIDSGIDKDYLDFYTSSTVKDRKEV